MKKIIAALLIAFLAGTTAHAEGAVFHIPTLHGKMLTFKGIPEGIITEPYQGKIVFIEFWGTWCGPCLLSIPHHVALQEKYKDQLRIISFETTPSVTRDQLKAYVKDPKNIDMKRVAWYMNNKAKTPAQKQSLLQPIATLKAFRAAGKPINYDVVASADAGSFVNYIAQRAQWKGYIPYLLVFDGRGALAGVVPGMPTEAKLEAIIQRILKKK